MRTVVTISSLSVAAVANRVADICADMFGLPGLEFHPALAHHVERFNRR
jgi:formyltetrahydrofolate synthetase